MFPSRVESRLPEDLMEDLPRGRLSGLTPPPESLSGLALEMHTAFSPDGLLAQSPDFEYRAEQQRMAVEVGQALEKKRPVIIEAGTGVGKSLAYLLPAVLTALRQQRKAVISTHTINLQEQLISKDIPIVQKLVPTPFSAVLLKGRGNYLCPQRLSRAMRSTGDLFSTAEHDELRALWKWKQETRDGTLSDLNFSPSPNVWAQVCSEAHVCTPRSCAPGSGCYYQEARRAAAEAQVLVLNHTLFFTLLSAQDEMGAEGEGFLFANDFVVMDEAHTLENTAARQLGLNLSQSSLRFDLNRLYNPRTQKGLFAAAKSPEGVVSTAKVLEQVEGFFQSVKDAAKFSPAGREYRVRTAGLVENTLGGALLEVVQCVRQLADDKENPDNTSLTEIAEMGRRLAETRSGLEEFLTMAREGHVYWVERSGIDQRNISLHAAPVDVSGLLRQIFFSGTKTCILTSATFGAGEPQLRYFRRRCGAEKVRAVQIGSPFDWTEQMKLHLVRQMPDPNAPGYDAALEEWVKHYLEQSQGRAFVLFTSYKLMENLASRMERWFQQKGWDLLVQGKGRPRHQLLQDFKEDVSSVLFGTESFWTGVDVPGEALSNVIITRLPFAVPDHPLTAARIEHIEDHGGNPFSEYSVPEAVLKLRQGIGRLIRTRRDHGIAVILDPRVLTKSYGKIFLDALPPAPRVIAG